MKRKNFSIITLLTDFNKDDHFVGTMKGVILNINPHAEIVDICHNVKPQDIEEAAYLLLSSFSYFPKNTIHTVVVDPGVGGKRKIILVETKNYLFLAPDNGVLSWALMRDSPQRIMEVKNKRYFLKNISSTFHGRDIFAPVAGYLSKGVKTDELGEEIKDIQKLKFPKVLKTEKRLQGEVIYIDGFGNLITNIEEKDTPKIKKIKIKKISIKKIYKSYSEVKKGEILALGGSSGFLEISVNLGSAHMSLKAKKGDKVVCDIE